MSEPVNELWIRVVLDKARLGWLLIDDKTTKEDREF
jgi:hypothetical protein